MVGPRFKRNIPFVKLLLKEKDEKNRQQMIKNAGTDEIFALMDAAYNILNFKFPLTPKQRRKLAGFAKSLRHLAKKKTADQGRRIIQKGRGPLIAALLVPVVAEVARHIISRITS